MYFRFAICRQLTRKAAISSEPCIVDYRRINGPDKPSGPLYMHVSYMQRRIQRVGGGGGGTREFPLHPSTPPHTPHCADLNNEIIKFVINFILLHQTKTLAHGFKALYSAFKRLCLV